jgi:glucose-1-phosphate thymidylyltransferase
LGDNVFYGRGFTQTLSNTRNHIEKNGGGAIFGYYVKDPGDFGVVEFDSNGKALSLEEKPACPKSHYAVPGLYFFYISVVNVAKNIQPSARGEMEITAVNKDYLERGKLSVETLGRGMAWLDTGTYAGLLEAANFIETIQKRQGLYVSCIEEIAYINGWIDRESLLRLAEGYKTEYGEYLRYIAENT